MAQFPTAVWDGKTPTRDNTITKKAPDASDWDTITQELQATQNQLKADEASFGAFTLSLFTAITLSNSWTNKTNFAVAGYRKQGARVYFNGAITAGTKTDATTLFTLPAGFRPTHPLTFPVCPSGADAGDANMRILFGVDGTAKVYGLSATVSIDLSNISFSIDQ